MSLMSKEEIEADLEAALMRTKSRQEAELSLLLSHVMDLKNVIISSKSKKIYGMCEYFVLVNNVQIASVL